MFIAFFLLCFGTPNIFVQLCSLLSSHTYLTRTRFETFFLEKRVGNIYIKNDGKLNTDDERASDVEHFME